MSLTEETIRKRLGAINTSQDSVQTASLWIMHYKDSAIDKVTKCWMDVYKNADDQLRIALIYVMNDVVQKVNKKDRNNNVKMAFHPYVVNACGLANNVVKKPISRVVDVFSDREIYPAHIIDEMRAALGISKSAPKDGEFDENFSEIDYSAIIKEIELYCQNEELTEKARNILERSNFNFKEKMQDRMKDKVEGKKILAELEESKNKLIHFLNSVERHQNKCQRLVELLKSLKSSFNLQLRDVTVVDDAYEKFATGILETKKQLDVMLMENLKKNESINQQADNNNLTDSSDDMEMDEDDCPPSHNTSLILPKDYVPAQPTTSTLDPRLQRLLNQNTKKLNQSEQREIASVVVGINNSKISINDPRQKSRNIETNNNNINEPTTSTKINSYKTTTNLLLPSTQMQPITIDTTTNASTLNSTAYFSPPQPINIQLSAALSTTTQSNNNFGLPVSSVIYNQQNSSMFSYPPGMPPPISCSLNFSMPPPFITISQQQQQQQQQQQISSDGIISHSINVSTAKTQTSNLYINNTNNSQTSPLQYNWKMSQNVGYHSTILRSGQKRKYLDSGSDDTCCNNDNLYDPTNVNSWTNNCDKRWENQHCTNLFNKTNQRNCIDNEIEKANKNLNWKRNVSNYNNNNNNNTSTTTTTTTNNNNNNNNQRMKHSNYRK